MAEPEKWEPEELSPKTQSAFQQLSRYAAQRKAEVDRQVYDLLYPGMVQRARSVFADARMRGDMQAAKEWAVIGIALATQPEEETEAYD